MIIAVPCSAYVRLIPTTAIDFKNHVSGQTYLNTSDDYQDCKTRRWNWWDSPSYYLDLFGLCYDTSIKPTFLRLWFVMTCPWFCPWFHTISIHFSQAVASCAPRKSAQASVDALKAGLEKKMPVKRTSISLWQFLSRQFMIGVDWYGLIEFRNSTKSGVFQDSQCSSWGI